MIIKIYMNKYYLRQDDITYLLQGKKLQMPQAHVLIRNTINLIG